MNFTNEFKIIPESEMAVENKPCPKKCGNPMRFGYAGGKKSWGCGECVYYEISDKLSDESEIDDFLNS